MPVECPRCGMVNQDGRSDCAVCGTPLAGEGYAVTARVDSSAQAALGAPDPPGVAGSQEAGVSAPPYGEGGGFVKAPTPGVEIAPPTGQADPLVEELAGPGTDGLLQPPPPAAQAEPQVNAAAEPEPPVSAPAFGEATAEVPAIGLMPAQMAPQAAYGPWGMQGMFPYGYAMWPEQAAYMQAYGLGAFPFPPMSPFGAYGPYPPFAFYPPMPFGGAGYPPYGMPYYPPPQPPYQGGYGAPSPYPAPYPDPYARVKRSQPMKAVYIVLIVIGVLLLIGGGVTAAILLTGKTKSSFKLGSASVTGTNIHFSGLVLKQSGSAATLSGKYTNSTKRRGDVYITVDGMSGSREQLLSFTVPVVPGAGKSFSKKKALTGKLTSATLGALIFQSSTSDSNTNDTNTYPWDEQTNPTSPTNPSSSSSSSVDEFNSSSDSTNTDSSATDNTNPDSSPQYPNDSSASTF